MRRAILAVALAAPLAAQAWTFETRKDPMGRGDTQLAAATSNNEVEFAFPYQGRQRGELTLRQKAGELNVILSVRKGQFLCGIDACTMLVRFDQQPPVKWSASPPADHSSTYLFLNSEKRFLDALRKAKVVRIEATFFQSGSKVFEFSVSDLGTWPAKAK